MFIRRIDVPAAPKKVYWNDAGDQVNCHTRGVLYLAFRRSSVDAALQEIQRAWTRRMVQLSRHLSSTQRLMRLCGQASGSATASCMLIKLGV